MPKYFGEATGIVPIFKVLGQEMTSVEKQRLVMKAEIFRAMGQPIRLRIIEMLFSNEMQVGRIAVQLGTKAANISKHLTLLRKHGLIVARKEGPNIFYRGTIPDFLGFMWCAEKVVRQRLNDRKASNTDVSSSGKPYRS